MRPSVNRRTLLYGDNWKVFTRQGDLRRANERAERDSLRDDPRFNFASCCKEFVHTSLSLSLRIATKARNAFSSSSSSSFSGPRIGDRRITRTNEDKRCKERGGEGRERRVDETLDRGIILEVGVKSVGGDQDKSFAYRAFIQRRVFTRPRARCINDTLTKIRGKPRDTGAKFFETSATL